MSDRTIWHGYGLVISENGYTASSLIQVDEKRVFGADSDHNTLAFALLDYLEKHGTIFEMIDMSDEFDSGLINNCFGLSQKGEDDDCFVTMHAHDACISLCITGENFDEADFFEPRISGDAEILAKISDAWHDEIDVKHVSQGAYVSSQQHDESSIARLRLSAQVGSENLIWPPRELQYDGTRTEDILQLENKVKVLSWTKLSAGGAPSEFSIRSPILGGITTIFAGFDEGPKGVFMLSDDLGNPEVKMGDKFSLAVRRLYAQEGKMRYSLKAIRDD